MKVSLYSLYKKKLYMVHYTIKHSLARTISFKYKNLKKKKTGNWKTMKKEKKTPDKWISWYYFLSCVIFSSHLTA